jgi:hypothetical protein
MGTRLSVSIRFLALAITAAWLSSGVQSAAPEPSSTRSTSATPVDSPPGFLANFVANQGQWQAPVRFAARLGELALTLEPHTMRLRLDGAQAATLAFVFEGANDHVTPAGENRRPGVLNFISGKNTNAWWLNVPSFESVLYHRMYDGIDVRVRNVSQRFEYDLLVAPHADVRQVVVRVDGATSLALTPDGGLIVETEAGVMRQTPPATLEKLPDGTLRPLASVFRIVDKNRYGFEVRERDPALPLVIDPGLIWSTLIGGTGHESLAGIEAARDGSGDVFMSGSSYSTDFGDAPTPVQSGRYKTFVARLDATGAHYEFVTFINGLQNQTYPGEMAADTSGGVTLIGWRRRNRHRNVDGQRERTQRRTCDIESDGHQRIGWLDRISNVQRGHVDHAVGDQWPRRNLVQRMLDRREQDQDVHVHLERKRVRYGERAVVRCQASAPADLWTSKSCRTRGGTSTCPGRDDVPRAREPRSSRPGCRS